MNVLLINPPSPYLENDAAYPPSGLLYIAASLEALGYAVKVIDLAGQPLWEQQIAGLDADLFGITCVTPNFKIVQTIAQRLPKGKPIIIGGAHPTFLPNDVIEHIRCDAVVKGEAELVISQILADAVEGRLQRIYEGGCVPIEAICKPSRHLVDLHRYRPGGEDTTPVYSSRGCPFNCAFCSKVTNRTYRTFSDARVVEEITDVTKLGFRKILFGDDDIAIDTQRLQHLLRIVKPFKISFRLNQDAKMLQEETIKIAADAGCYEISFGIESGSPKMLKEMNKQASLEDNKLAIKLTKAYGIKAKAYFLVNFPGEDEKTVAETIRFVEETKPDKWLLSAFAPLPGSDTFNNPRKYGIKWLSPNWQDYYIVGKHGSFRPCFKTDDLGFQRQQYLHDMLYTGLKNASG